MIKDRKDVGSSKAVFLYFGHSTRQW